jgi:RHS repeat-associated protein
MTAQLGENSHPGFEGIKAALCLAEMDANSNLTSGMQPCVRRNGTGSRCSGKERDSESGLDYFLARYYSGAQGRFTTVDRGNPDPMDPQSWNGYAYALNNPLKYVDPDGESATLAGALLGGLIGGGSALIQGKSWREVGAAAAGGAVAGAMMGSVVDTGGASLPLLLAAGGLSGAAGGSVERVLLGKPTTARDIAVDATAGTAGIMMGAAIGKFASGIVGEVESSVGKKLTNLAIRDDVVLTGGRSGEKVKGLIGPADSVVKGAGERIFVTDGKGRVILDITRDRVKPVTPGAGFGAKRSPTEEELKLLQQVWKEK